MPPHSVLIIQSGKEAFPLLWVGNSQVIDDSLEGPIGVCGLESFDDDGFSAFNAIYAPDRRTLVRHLKWPANQ